MATIFKIFLVRRIETSWRTVAAWYASRSDIPVEIVGGERVCVTLHSCKGAAGVALRGARRMVVTDLIRE